MKYTELPAYSNLGQTGRKFKVGIAEGCLSTDNTLEEITQLLGEKFILQSAIDAYNTPLVNKARTKGIELRKQVSTAESKIQAEAIRCFTTGDVEGGNAIMDRLKAIQSTSAELWETWESIIKFSEEVC